MPVTERNKGKGRDDRPAMEDDVAATAILSLNDFNTACISRRSSPFNGCVVNTMIYV